MGLACPICGAAIDAADVNVAKDVMFCRACSQASSLSGVVADQTRRAADPLRASVDINNPPRGAWSRDEGDVFRVGATTRSLLVFFLVPFTAVWSGGSLGGIYGSQIASGQFNPLLSLFGIPFLLGSFFLWGMTLMTIFGRVEVAIRGDEGVTFTGVGPLGWRRRFECGGVAVIREEPQYNRGNQYQVIVIEGATRIRFGSMLNDARRYFMIEVLKTLVLPDKRR